MMRNFDPKGTAGLERRDVSGASRVPWPPARIIPRMRLAMIDLRLLRGEHLKRACPGRIDELGPRFN
jgi:hypothetical protein